MEGDGSAASALPDATSGCSSGSGGGEKSHIIKLKGLFGLLINTQDETVIRPTSMPFPLLQANPNFVDGIASRDVVISDSPSIWARIFLPEKATFIRSKAAALKNLQLENSGQQEQQQQQEQHKVKKVPVILYFHGGGLVLLSPDISFYHQFCEKVARRANAIVISVDYRLTPEHRLPAAYDDAFTSLRWLTAQANVGEELVEPWLGAYADFERVFVMGDSAGANIAHHLCVRAATEGLNSDTRGGVKLVGQILLQPMTGGANRLRSEVEGVKSGFFSYTTNDWLWRLALPKGAGMDHPYCDLPAAAAALGQQPELKLPPALVILGGLDWMHDRQFEYVAAMRRAGKQVELSDFEHSKHGFFIYDGEDTGRLLRLIASFTDKNRRPAAPAAPTAPAPTAPAASAAAASSFRFSSRL